ncbi:MAG: methionine adenosyltransferase, partial [Anaerolineae bacterium]
QGKEVPVGEIATETAKKWLRENLRFVDPNEHVRYQNEIGHGSPELVDIFEREVIGANDTSAAVGYAPMTETEKIVLATEKRLNSPEFKKEFPVAGEDIKVMGYRFDRRLVLTVAVAFVDRFVESEKGYFAQKKEIEDAVRDFVKSRDLHFKDVRVDVNTLDQPGRGEAGMYLTVLGTSAEGADGGQVGRGNKVNGVIALNRPMSTEAAAGKNPISHVGKIYNLLAHRIADEVYKEVPGIREVYIWLCSQIGQPIDQPLIASVQLVLRPNLPLSSVSDEIKAVIERELANIYDFTQRLAQGEFPVW